MPSNPRILLVDDDPDISLALSDYLQGEGFEVEVAETGSAALHKGTTQPYDVVLLDVGLPDLDGIQVLEKLAHTKPKLPIILLTAFTSLPIIASPNIINKAFAFLTKPYSREAVKALINRAIIRPNIPHRKGKAQSSRPQNPLRFSFILDPGGSNTGPRYQLTLQEYQRLEEYVHCMQFTFDIIPEAILIADAEKRFRFANHQACEALGYTREEMQTLRIPDIAPNHDHQRFQNHLRALRQEHTLSYSTIHRTKSGQDLAIEISVYLLKFHGQEFTCAMTRPIFEEKGEG